MLDGVTRRKLRLPGSGAEIALLDWGGDGPLALLHHANGFCGALWEAVANELQPYFRVVAMDARGHGDSSPPANAGDLDWSLLADDLEAVAELVIDSFGVERIGLGLGHSFGGSLTAVVAARRPTFYQRIVLVDPVLYPPNIDPKLMRGNELALRTRKRRRRFESRRAARDYFATKPLFEAFPAQALDLYVGEGLRDLPEGGVGLKCAPEIEAQIFGGPHTLDLYEAADQLEIPALVLWATRGNFPREAFEEWVARIQRGTLAEIEGGHLIAMEDPKRVAAATLAFCADLLERGS